MRMRSLKSIIFQRKSKSQVTAPDDKQVAILKNGLQILMCKVLILAMILLKKLQMTPQVKTTKHVQKSDLSSRKHLHVKYATISMIMRYI